MKISEGLLPEFDHEMANTRKTLERIPDDKFGWKPHEKSMPLGRLAIHLAALPSWAVDSIQKDSFDIAPPDDLRTFGRRRIDVEQNCSIAPSGSETPY